MTPPFTTRLKAESALTGLVAVKGKTSITPTRTSLISFINMSITYPENL
jgi:hypothetical protein